MRIPRWTGWKLDRPSRLGRWELLLLFFLLGLFAIVAQSILVREFLVVACGSELSLGLTFFGWLAGVALGAWAGGRVRGGERLRRWLFVGSIVLLVYLLPVLIVLVRSSRLLLDVRYGEFLPLRTMLWLNPLLTVPAAALIGFAFPLASGLMTRGGASADPIARIYATEAAGSLIGGALFSFVLIERVPALRLAFALGLLMLLALMLVTVGRPWWRIALGPALGVFLLAGIIGIEMLREGSLQLRWDSFRTGTALVPPSPLDSRYQNIALGERRGEFTLFLDGLKAMNFPAPAEHGVAAHFVMCEAKNVRRVLLVGGGIEGVLSEMLKHPVEHVDYVSLDPKLVTLVKPHLHPADRLALDDTRVELSFGDARRFLATRPADAPRYDLIFLDLPEPTSVLLNRFYTVTFFRIAREHLADDGLLVFRLTAAPAELSPESLRYLASIWNALGLAFEHRLATWGIEMFVFASPGAGVFTTDGAELARRYESRGVRSNPLYRFWLEGGSDMLNAEKLKSRRAELDSASDEPANTDEHPRAAMHNLVLADLRISADLRPEERRMPTLAWLEALSLNRVLLAAAAVFGAWVLFARWPMRKPAGESAALFSVATTGFTSMSLELVLLTVFQYLYGYVYVRVGIIVGVFMLGLVAGSLAMNRRLRSRPAWGVGALRHLDAAIAALCVLTPLLITLLKSAAEAPALAWTAEWGLMTLVLVSGLLGGAVFPLAARIVLTRRTNGGASTPACPLSSSPAASASSAVPEACRPEARLSATAGAVDAADHVGACVGALIAGIALIPALGLIETCMFLGVLKVFSALFLFFAGLSR